jgi:hypothetical protein
MSVVPWWRLAPFDREPFVCRWVRAGDDADAYEARLLCGPEISVACLRARRWAKVVYCEPGRSRNVRGWSSQVLKGEMMSFIKRGLAAAVVGGPVAPFPDAKFAKDWPAIYEYMTASKYPDGTDRKLSSVTLFCEDSQLKVCLTEKNEGLVLFAAGKTLQTALNALEGLLAAEETPWRRSAYGASGTQGKGKRGG